MKIKWLSCGEINRKNWLQIQRNCIILQLGFHFPYKFLYTHATPVCKATTRFQLQMRFYLWRQVWGHIPHPWCLLCLRSLSIFHSRSQLNTFVLLLCRYSFIYYTDATKPVLLQPWECDQLWWDSKLKIHWVWLTWI